MICAKKEQKDQAIIRAAEDEFLAKGLDGASMESIAKNAQVSKRTLYKYYPTKEDLFNALLYSIFDCVGQILSFPFSPDVPIKDQVNEILEIKIQICQNPYLLKVGKIMAMEQLKNTNINSNFLNKIREKRKLFEDWIIKCQKHNMINNKFSPTLICDFTMASLDGLIIWPIILGMKQEITQDEIKSYKEIIVNSFIQNFCN